MVSQQSDELLHTMDHTETPCLDSTASTTLPAQADDLATQTDATQVSKGTCFTFKSQNDPTVVLDSDAGTQTHSPPQIKVPAFCCFLCITQY